MALRISPNFTLEEFEKSATAMACGIDNRATIPVVWNICALVALVLQPLREELGQPVIISSGYRCKALNEELIRRGHSASPTSFHLDGRAADIHLTSNAQGQQIYDILHRNPYVDKVLYEKSATAKWIHVQISVTPRNYGNPNYIA